MSKKKQRKIAARQVQATSVKKEKISSATSGSMTNWLVVLVAILPFIITSEPLDPVLMPRYLFLGLFLLLFVLVFFFYRSRFVPINTLSKPVKIALGLSLAYGIWSILSMFSSIEYREGYFDTFRHGLNLVLLYVVMNVVLQEEGQWMKIAKTIVIVSLILELNKKSI